MSGAGFCTACGAARGADARFCTACGATFGNAPSAAASGAASSVAAAPPSSAKPVARSLTTPALGAAGLLLAAGSAALFLAMQTPSDVPRAVPGSPGAPAGARQGGGQAAQGEGLPQGHPSIELPKEVIDFLEGLAAEADKDPKNVDAVQKLARARYRASALNPSYRAPAGQAVDRLLALDPSNVEGLRLSANLAYDAGDFVEAEKRFRVFLEKVPGDVSAITDLGSVLLFQDRLDDAIASYRSALARDEKFLQAHFNLGIALQKQGKKDEALASLRRASALAETPEQKQHVDGAIADLEGRPATAPTAAAPPGAGTGAPPAAAPPAAPGGGMAMPPPAPERDVPTNASTDFQRAAQKPLVTHPIVGPRVTDFEWTGPAALRVRIADFPMDQMPPFARVKFKTGLGERLGALAKENRVDAPVTVELVDAASGRVMDTIDSSAAPAGPGGAR